MDPDHPERPDVWTGVVCRQCREPVVVIEKTLPHGFVLHCPSCDYRWTTDGSYVPDS